MSDFIGFESKPSKLVDDFIVKTIRTWVRVPPPPQLTGVQMEKDKMEIKHKTDDVRKLNIDSILQDIRDRKTSLPYYGEFIGE